MNAAIVLLASISIFRMGGDIDVPDASAGAFLRTMGGDIRVAHGNGCIVAKTMGGNIDIQRLEGSADVGTMGGNVTVTVVGGGRGRAVQLRSMGGEIEVTLPRDFDADFTVELEQGDRKSTHRIVSDIPLEKHESTHWRLFGGRYT